jgi:hypothetical protein
MGHFAELLVFNDLTPFFVSRESPTSSRPYETASRPAAKFWKTVTNICRFVKEKVDCLAGRPSLDPALSPPAGNRPNETMGPNGGPEWGEFYARYGRPSAGQTAGIDPKLSNIISI